MVSPAVVARVRHGLLLPRRNPLDYWKHASAATRKATAAIAKLIEIFVRAGNKSGKTNWGAAVVVALCQRRRELDGVPLPEMPKKVVAAVLSLDHQQQALSVQPAYLSMLGDWPHVVGWKSRSQDIVGTIRVKQVDGGDDPKDWSVIHFISQENPNAVVGARLHIAHADEPPKEHIWNEVRARGFANQPFIRIITATPLVRRQWAPLQRWFPEEHTGHIHNHRLEVRLSVYDNRFLSDTDKARLESDYADDPLRAARLSGDYIDAFASCPFDQNVILHLLEQASVPRLVRFKAARSGEDSKEELEVEVWEEEDPKESYYIPIDASAGIADALHDPCGLQVWARGRVRMVARYNGYADAYQLGILAAELGKKYNRALLDPETSGGWGVAVVHSLQQVGYGNIVRQPRELMPGKWGEALGFVTSEHTRPGMVSAIQDFLRSVRDGRPTASMPSADVLRCWQDTILNEKGKPVAAPGLHDEDLILAGQALKKLTRRKTAAAQPTPERKAQTLADLFKAPARGMDRLIVRLRYPT